MPYESAIIYQMYDADYAALRTPSGDVEFYRQEAARAGGPILEFGCGSGRILLPIARDGGIITGVDSSPGMLKLLADNLEHEADATRRRVTSLEGDMCRTRVPGPFELVTIPFRAVAHVLEAADQVDVFRNMRRHLGAGGRLIFDVFNPNPAFLIEPGGERLDIDREEAGRKIRRYSSVVPDRGRQVSDVTFRWEIETEGRPVEEHRTSFPMRWFYRYEIEHLLERCGFQIEAVFGNFDRSDFDGDAPEMIFVARPGAG